MSLLLVIIAAVTVLIYIGRMFTPAGQRKPMVRPREIARNFWKGVGIVFAPSPVNQALDAFDRDIASGRGGSPGGQRVSSNRLSQTRASNF